MEAERSSETSEHLTTTHRDPPKKEDQQFINNRHENSENLNISSHFGAFGATEYQCLAHFNHGPAVGPLYIELHALCCGLNYWTQAQPSGKFLRTLRRIFWYYIR